MIWNRRQWLKDPETGKRRYVDRPKSEWQEREQPELRIVADATWRAVRVRADEQAHRGTGIAVADLAPAFPDAAYSQCSAGCSG